MTPTVRDVAPEDWPALAAGFRDLTFEQTLTYGRAAAVRIGGGARFVVVERGGMPVAAACLRVKRVPGLGRGIVWIAGGPLVQRQGAPDPSPEELGAVLAALRDHVTRQGHILRLRFPGVARHDPGHMDAIARQAGLEPTERAASYRSVITDLDCDDEALMARLHGKWRGHLRKALKAGLELEHGPIAELAGRFQALYETVSEDKGFRPDILPEFYYGLDGPDFAHEVLIARKDGEDLAGITVGISGPNAVYLYGATAHAGRSLSAGYFLTWEGYRLARERGCTRYDLGGVDAEANPSVTEFKQRAGGEEVLAAGPYEARAAGLLPALVTTLEGVHGAVRRLRRGREAGT